jgi:hypothetical protein
MKKLFSLSALVIAAALLVAPSVLNTASAAEFIAPHNDNKTITLSSGENHKNVYIAGGSVFVNSNVAGDLYAAGGTIIVEGNVEQDVVIAGGNVTLNGTIGGDLRVAGGTVIINGQVNGDVLVGGGNVNITEKSKINGDLAAGTGSLSVDGSVAGNVNIGGGQITLNSSLPGKVTIMAGESLTIGSKAIIPQAVSYKGQKEATVEDGAQVSSIDFQQVEHRSRAHHAVAAIFTIMFVLKVMGLFVAGLILIKLFPRTNRQLAESMQKGIWANLGLGVVGFIVIPIVAIICMALIVGLYVGVILLLGWLLMLTIASLIASVVTGAWIVKKLTKKDSMVYDWQALLIGLIAISLIYLLPFIGVIVMFGLILMAFGGLMRHFHDHVKSEHNA